MPGAGKSTLSRRVCATLNRTDNTAIDPVSRLNEKPADFRRPLAKLPYAAYGWLQEPVTLFRYISRDNQGLNVALLYNWFFVRGVTQWYAATGQGVTLCDQGMIQGLWSFKLSEPDHVVALFRDSLLNAYPKMTSLIVSVSATPEIVASRLADRNNNPSRVGVGETALFDLSDTLDAQRYTEEVIDQLVDVRPQSTILTLQNDDRGDLENNVEMIVDEIRMRCRRQY